MTVTAAAPWDTTAADATPSSTHAKQQRSANGPSDSVLNAFAATLAAMLAPATPFATAANDSDATSDLDTPAAMSAAAGATTPTPSSGHGDPAAPLDGGTAAPNQGLAASDDAAASTAAPGTVTTTDPRPAYASAADARATASSAPVTNVNASSDALNPEFRARLNRVMTRMHDELGHDVELVEGFRPQSRQDYLYAQGRSRSGPVVTWTRSSKHTLGLAADLKIDGSYDNPAAYQQLARIAAQEGLRTLGSRDPGHVELASRGGAAAWGAAASNLRLDDNVSRALELALSNDAGGSTGHTQSDTDGINGLLSRATRGSAAPAPGTVPYGGSSAGFGTGLGGGTQNGQSGGGFDSQRQPQHDTRPATGIDTRADAAGAAQSAQPAAVARVADVAQVAQVAPVAQVAMPGSVASSAHQSAHMSSAGDIIAPPSGALSAARVGHLLDVRDATPAQPLSHVTLDLDNATGGSDRITVQMRGGAVDTSIALGDSSRADKMSLRVGELQHALEQHGLETGAIQVAQTGTDNSAGWTPRQGGDQRGADQRPAPNYRDHRQDADDARQRSRREQQGGRQQ